MSVPPISNPDKDLDIVPQEKQKKKRSGFSTWVRTFFIALLLAIVVKVFFLEAFVIPSNSMEGTLKTGDFIFVNKLHYGPRTPQTWLQIPLTHQSMHIPGLGTRKTYLDAAKLPTTRLPGYSSIKRGDVVVFNHPPSNHPVSQKTHYVKRCVALAGDTVKIVDMQLIVNGQKQGTGNKVLYQFNFGTQSKGGNEVLDKQGISYEEVNGGGYRFWATQSQANDLSQNKKFSANGDKPLLIRANKEVRNPHIFPQDEAFDWNEDFFGPLIIPKKGTVMPMISRNVILYKDLIQRFEGLKKGRVEIYKNQLLIDGKVQERYTFKNNYYFMLGDSRHNSLDSRYWGLVPENHIVGKVAFTLFSLRPNVPWLSTTNWLPRGVGKYKIYPNFSKFRKKRWFKAVK
ncbi:signal peptidase I [Microscilla marina]|uniref:Signal peptidase I n=1 Tax=Microscilla marina ATCC 23134 TaxID=313606 RepID=A1ZZK7_MICM2|nr:signal peptidase I [Microscilla marina]EAY24202.1 signal peptidase I [Microscilla marina ATCC 23134]